MVRRLVVLHSKQVLSLKEVPPHPVMNQTAINLTCTVVANLFEERMKYRVSVFYKKRIKPWDSARSDTWKILDRQCNNLPIKISKTFIEKKVVARALRGHQTQTSLMAEPGSEHGLPYVGHHMTKTVAWSDKNHQVPNCHGWGQWARMHMEWA